ncbi:MAG: transcription elongation factor GreA [Bacteroidia bacterium]|nr:transcription elongation factor GreA [Bacteroidia bacterium]MCF8427205.1 transcription elongation factor GreA [Bacteroidia bacterium]MCF8445406.1 transcription elongation factor GreA [Bacteroidia bacterium]
MAEINYLTQEGLEKMKAELYDLKYVQRPFLSKQIADARDKGDLSENAEYHAAKEDQGLLEAKISKMENLLSISRIIDESKLSTDKVMMLTKVRVLNHNSKKEIWYTLVNEKEADLKTGKISFKSPIGIGLMNKKIGDISEVVVPAGTIKLEILEITL